MSDGVFIDNNYILIRMVLKPWFQLYSIMTPPSFYIEFTKSIIMPFYALLCY